MAGTTLSQMSDILRTHYLGDNKWVYEVEKRWTCSRHDKPDYDRYKEVCSASGDACPDPYECLHVESVLIRVGCPECKESEWVEAEPFNVLISERNGIQRMFDRELIFLEMLTQ